MVTPSRITSRPPGVEFTGRFVQPPSALYVFRDDRLVLRSISENGTETLHLRCRLLTDKGRIITLDFQQQTDATTPKSTAFVLAEGFLLGCAVVQNVESQPPGQVFASVALARGGEDIEHTAVILCADWVTGFVGPTFPRGIVRSQADRPRGGLFTRFPPAPGAGTDFTYTVPTNIEIRPITLCATLTTDANVANRLVRFQHLTGTQCMSRSPAGAVQTASTTVLYTGGFFGTSGSSLGDSYLVPFPDRMWLDEGDTLGSNTENLQAGDNWTELFLQGESWIRP